MSYRFRVAILLIPVLLVAFLQSCKDEKEEEITPAQQAEIYYNMLAKGQYEDFVRGTYGCDSLPGEYLSQRIDLLAQHVKKEQGKRNGYVSFKALSDEELSDTEHLVYLEVVFGDSTRERIACPLILKDGRWLMRN